MVNKQDLKKYLKLRTDEKIKEVQAKYNDMRTEWREAFNENKQKVFKKMGFKKPDDRNERIEIKIGNQKFTVSKSDYFIRNRVDDVAKEITGDNPAYEKETAEIKAIRKTAMDIEKNVLLYGMSDELKKLIEGF